MVKRIVVDAPVAIDLFIGRDKVRVDASEEFFNTVRESLVEAGGVIAHYIPKKAFTAQ